MTLAGFPGLPAQLRTDVGTTPLEGHPASPVHVSWPLDTVYPGALWGSEQPQFINLGTNFILNCRPVPDKDCSEGFKSKCM